MKIYPKEPARKEDTSDYSHLSGWKATMRLMAILLVGGLLSFIFFKIVLF